MKHAGQATEAIVETIDLYPTLCELAGVPVLAGLSGSSLLPHLDDPKTSGGEAVSYFGANETIRTDRHRLIRHNNGKKQPAYELYDHSSPEKETKNIANAHPDLVRDLAAKLDAKLGK
jgi:iduronate 2-sulfatase